ncbi:hypothetical protein [Lihuaxuella thermophila]|nr:hypothetical protein [Lihuaxuella thermophila]
MRKNNTRQPPQLASVVFFGEGAAYENKADEKRVADWGIPVDQPHPGSYG